MLHFSFVIAVVENNNIPLLSVDVAIFLVNHDKILVSYFVYVFICSCSVFALLFSLVILFRIHAFLDSEEKELGDSFPSTIENAIHSASAHIAIFSNRYAESSWCLAELVLMLQSSAKIIPLFYGVEPSDLRFVEKGKYAKAFTEYEQKKRYLEKLGEWKEALQSVSFITGYEINSNFM